MDDEEKVRRGLHSLAGLTLIYYLFPKSLYGISRDSILLLFVISVLSFEVLRLYFDIDVFGLRQYESNRMGAYAWALLAASGAMLFFPMHLAALCIIGMGIIDPLIGEIHHIHPKLYPYLPFLIWTTIGLVLLTLLSDHQLGMVLILSLVGASLSILIERPNLAVDDDFLLIAVPIVVLRGIEIGPFFFL